jgi:hypothetical protein
MLIKDVSDVFYGGWSGHPFDADRSHFMKFLHIKGNNPPDSSQVVVKLPTLILDCSSDVVVHLILICHFYVLEEPDHQWNSYQIIDMDVTFWTVSHQVSKRLVYENVLVAEDEAQ